MRSTITTLILGGFLITAPLIATAAPASQAQSSKPAAKHEAASHAVTGTVKSVDANTLVITKDGKNGADMTFDVSASTQKSGDVAAGSQVSVRYHDDASRHVATAITAHHPAHASTPAKTSTAK